MSVAIITGSGGLVGAEASRYFCSLGFHVVGMDNNMRAHFFGPEASTAWQVERLSGELGSGYTHFTVDIRDEAAIGRIFQQFGSSCELILHAAAQPSHDWAANDPGTDFSINATGTLNLLQAYRQECPGASFIFTSTNKVYGDHPNQLPLVEKTSRWEIAAHHHYREGITEKMSIDQCLHSIFGASKVAADILVQEFGRYFGLNTVCFRGGCLTGPYHSGAELHGFLAYLMKSAATGKEYWVHGYGGKQVRDNICSEDLLAAFMAYHQDPRPGEVYNIGGGRQSNCSLLEAVALCEEIVAREMKLTFLMEPRVGDHQWWISDMAKFRSHYPEWAITRDVPQILREIHDYNHKRWISRRPSRSQR